MSTSARVTALRLLTRREYTTAELRATLADRELAADDIDEAVRSLTADRLLDDRRAAVAHARTASRVKGRGRLRILRELEARGLDRALAREVVDELPAVEEAAALARFLERKRLPARLTPAEHRRIFQQLLRKGFPADVVSKALRTRGTDED